MNSQEFTHHGVSTTAGSNQTAAAMDLIYSPLPQSKQYLEIIDRKAIGVSDGRDSSPGQVPILLDAISSTTSSTTVHAKYIRLLRLISGSAPSVVECELEVVELDHAPAYEAISYVWGDPDPPAQIICNGHLKVVTPNLESALQHLRLASTTRLLWIDAICVNQDDVIERSEQIQMMREIYSKPSRVLVWLGEDIENQAEPAIEFVKEVAERYCRKLNVSFTEATTVFNSANLTILREEQEGVRGVYPSDGDSRWPAVIWLYKHIWFERIWVVQEVAFSAADILIGSSTVDFKSVVFACWWILATNTYCSPSLLGLFHKVCEMSLVTRHSAHSFEQLVKTSTSMEATDPRDKLFALLGLAVPEDRLNPAFQPDYSKTVVEVYTEFTRYLATNDVLVPLWQFYEDRSDPFDTAADSKFPSWVVRYDRHATSRDLIIHQMGWLASGKSVTEVGSTTDLSILAMKGFKVSRISFSDHSLQCPKDSPWDHNPGDHVRYVWPNVTSFLDKGQEEPVVSQEVKDKFVLAISAGDSDLELGDDAVYFDDFVKRVSLFDGKLERLSETGVLRYSELHVSVRSKCFFILEDGRMGLGPNAAEPGDVVVIIFGHAIPYVLRPVDDMFLFLGPCYVNDIMQGQLMDDLKSGKYKEEWLHLR
ncbi:hypothetical protein VTL71DRAFT_13909 [Oculimacula yallundae]|uniref:Heterokaryon incompatibility domain-containing protein n=1 Tax=Oculimacula yallundae TaxID=86028 RepID=A0ABR4CNJ8_9HELO